MLSRGVSAGDSNTAKPLSDGTVFFRIWLNSVLCVAALGIYYRLAPLPHTIY
jgi:hypothetical protein